ncbi:hypothetical protein [Snodgrassella communis]|nr:hypothetical protein [Snodgrassella communis]
MVKVVVLPLACLLGAAYAVADGIVAVGLFDLWVGDADQITIFAPHLY